MKIGLVLFGHLRSFRSTHASYKDFLKTIQQVGVVDVFCHTWDIEESVTPSWWKEHKTDEPPPPTVNSDEIISKYAPLRYTIEPSRQFDSSGYDISSSIPVGGILSMLHSQKKAFDLLADHERQNGFTYDLIIKTRYDLVYEIAPPFASVVARSVSQHCLFLPSSNPYELIGSKSDVFAMGPRSLMEQYFSFCDNFREATVLYKSKNYRHFIPELCLTVYLENRSIPSEELTGLRIHILRSSGEKVQINAEKNFQDNNPHCFHLKIIEKNAEILPEGSDLPTVNGHRLAKKYTSWVDEEANETVLNRYADLYCGVWPGTQYISRLAKRSKKNKVFKGIVMKDFFEGAIRLARYGKMKTFLLALILSRAGGGGLYYFKIWKNHFVRK